MKESTIITISDVATLDNGENNMELKNFNSFGALVQGIKEGDCQKVSKCLEEVDIWQLNLGKDEKGNTVLHIALQKPQNHKIIIQLLNALKTKKFDVNIKNEMGMTPLYVGISNGSCDGVRCTSESWLSELLTMNAKYLEIEVDLNGPENVTPVQIAVSRKCQKCILPLVNAGAKLDFLLDEMNKAVSSGIHLKNHDGQYQCSSSCFKLQYDFRCILPNSNTDGNSKMETTFLELFRQFQTCHEIRNQIFLHPLVQAFLYLKWRRVRRLFYLKLILSILVSLQFTIYILKVYLHNCPYSEKKVSMSTVVTQVETENEANPLLEGCDKGFGSITYSILLMIITIMIFMIHVYRYYQHINKKLRLRNTERKLIMYFSLNHWLRLLEFALYPLIIFSVWPVAWSSQHKLSRWQYAIAAYGLFYMWASNLVHIRRFPNLGVYVEMVGKVLVKFGYLMSAYIFLLIAFAVSFLVIFPTYAPFQTIFRAILKVLTMMAGDVEYAEFFYGHHENDKTKDLLPNSDELFHPLTAHILYGAFIIICTIVLMNLLNGLAVGEINELQKNALLSKIKREIEEVANLESIFFHKNCLLPTLLLSWLRQSISVIDYSAHISEEKRFLHVVCPVHTPQKCFPTTPAIKHLEKSAI